MKISFPKVGKYVSNADNELNIRPGYSGNILAFKLYCLGWRIDKPIEDLFTKDEFDDSAECKVQIPYGTILTINSFSASAGSGWLKLTIAIKDNPQLKAKIDYKAQILSICPGFAGPPHTIRNTGYLSLEWYEAVLKRQKLTINERLNVFDGLELEEYVNP